MYFDRKCKITFIANGATIFSEDGRFTDLENYPPLNDEGQAEIDRICTFLKKRGIKNDKMFSSGALRSLQSAQLIAKIYKQDFEILDDLKPRGCGSFNGQTFEQLAQSNPKQLMEFLTMPERQVPEDAESVSDFIVRVKSSIDKIVNDNIGSRIIIVTHKDIIRAAICSAIGAPDSAFFSVYVKTGSATQISYFEQWSSLIYSDYTPI